MTASKVPFLNVGCGSHFHPAWTNVDLQARPGVIQHDLRGALPFEDGSFAAVYHSHVLEHLPHDEAPGFLRECARVLRSGGTIRVVVPDLETIARLYLRCLEAAVGGDVKAAAAYDWITLELLDQMVRTRSGGEMLAYWQQKPMAAEAFVIERMGEEVRAFLAQKPATPAPPVPLPPGERHQWMYDRFSLARLLVQTGFVDVRQQAAGESAIPGFREYFLDETTDGRVRKPDSLFMEARKP